MHILDMARGRPRKHRPRDPLDHGTPETRAKLQRDVVTELLRDNRIAQREHDAAMDIRTMWDALTNALWYNRGRMLEDTIAGTPPQPMEHLSHSQMNQWRHVWTPWANVMARQVPGALRPVSRMQYAIDVVVDNTALDVIAGRYSLPESLAIPELHDGLDKYAKLCGW